ncbi:MAG: hypothetical protein LBT67_00755 [Holosporaceae bacterium]|jgi:hypothetical protein|nr:hypothetical protein [Holosporaceae bacterium]
MERSNEPTSQVQPSSGTQKSPTSSWYPKCMSRTAKPHEGYLALQKNYPHNKKEFEETKSAFEKILADLKQGAFNNPGKQLVLDYMYYWFNIDPEQVYKKRYDYKDADGIWHVTWFEYEIRDLAAQILDALEQTGGLAYAYVHGH